MAVLIS